MALVVCTTALNQGSLKAVVGEVYDDTSVLVVKYPTFFSNPRRSIVDNSAAVFATPTVLTAAMSGTTQLVNNAAGVDFTLPTVVAGTVGIWYRFAVTTTITSNKFRVTAAAGQFLNGAVWIADFNTANTGAYFAADGTSHRICTMDGSTQGGIKGTVVEFTAISTTGWHIEAVEVFGDSTLATPFS